MINISIFSALPNTILVSATRNRQLIAQLAQREIIGRYRGSILGVTWSFLNPILMLVIYTVFFTVAIKIQWGDGSVNSRYDFAIILFIGLIILNFFAECLNKAPLLIIQNVNYVKKVIFPLEILPLVSIASALVHAGISCFVLLLAQLLLYHTLSWTIIFFPLIVLPFVFMVLGFSWFLAALGVYIRDVTQITGVLTAILLFMSPVFYPLSSLPLKMQSWIILNPLTFVIEQSRDVLVKGLLPNWYGLLIYSATSIVIAMFGFWFFQKMRKGFADVL